MAMPGVIGLVLMVVAAIAYHIGFDRGQSMAHYQCEMKHGPPRTP